MGYFGKAKIHTPSDTIDGLPAWEFMNQSGTLGQYLAGSTVYVGVPGGGDVDVIVAGTVGAQNTVVAVTISAGGTGYTGATGAFIAAVACNTVQYAAGIGTTLVENYALDGGALTALNMGIARDATLLHTTADVELLLTLNNDHNVDAGKLTLFVEYVQTGDIA